MAHNQLFWVLFCASALPALVFGLALASYIALCSTTTTTLADDARKKWFHVWWFSFSGGNNSCFGPKFSQRKVEVRVFSPVFIQHVMGEYYCCGLCLCCFCVVACIVFILFRGNIINTYNMLFTIWYIFFWGLLYITAYNWICQICDTDGLPFFQTSAFHAKNICRFSFGITYITI